MYLRHQLSDLIVDKTTFLKESTSSKAFDENERTNYRNDSTVQYSDAAANEKKRKCRRKVDEERKDERNY